MPRRRRKGKEPGVILVSFFGFFRFDSGLTQTERCDNKYGY